MDRYFSKVTFNIAITIVLCNIVIELVTSIFLILKIFFSFLLGCYLLDYIIKRFNLDLYLPYFPPIYRPRRCKPDYHPLTAAFTNIPAEKSDQEFSLPSQDRSSFIETLPLMATSLSRILPPELVSEILNGPVLSSSYLKVAFSSYIDPFRTSIYTRSLRPRRSYDPVGVDMGMMRVTCEGGFSESEVWPNVSAFAIMLDLEVRGQAQPGPGRRERRIARDRGAGIVGAQTRPPKDARTFLKVQIYLWYAYGSKRKTYIRGYVGISGREKTVCWLRRGGMNLSEKKALYEVWFRVSRGARVEVELQKHSGDCDFRVHSVETAFYGC